jgi:hypothetical protein
MTCPALLENGQTDMHPPPQLNGIHDELLLAVDQLKDLPIPPGARPDSPLPIGFFKTSRPKNSRFPFSA